MSSDNIQTEPVEEPRNEEEDGKVATAVESQPEVVAEVSVDDAKEESVKIDEQIQENTLHSEQNQSEEVVVHLEEKELSDTKILKEDTIVDGDGVVEENIEINDKSQEQKQTEDIDNENIVENEISEDVEENKKQSEQQLEEEEEEFDFTIPAEQDPDTIFELLEDEPEVEDEILPEVSEVQTEKRKKRRRYRKSVQTKIADGSILEPIGPSDEDSCTVVEEEEEICQTVFIEHTREEYYEMYNDLDKQYNEAKSINADLIRKLANYYTEKKLFHVFQEGKMHLDAVKKYEKQLDDFGRLTDESMAELRILEAHVSETNMKITQKESEAEACFEELQREEYDIGKEAIGSEHDEKLLDRYLRHQRIQLNLLKKIRFDYIKTRNKLTETQDALAALDNLGPDLRLLDYEQLKFDNRNLLDKLDDKELELTKVRRKCENTIQVLAHQREKCFAFEDDISDLKESIDAANKEYEDVREQVKKLKQERDMYRNKIQKFIKQLGLLSKPNLLRDVSKTIEESTILAERLEETRNTCDTLTKKVINLRRNLTSQTRLQMIQDKMNLDKVKYKPVISLYSDQKFALSNSDVSVEELNKFNSYKNR